MINELPFTDSYYNYNNFFQINDINDQIKLIFSEALKYNLTKGDLKINNEITFIDFVENSISIYKKTKTFNPIFEYKKYLKGKSEWGVVIL